MISIQKNNKEKAILVGCGHPDQSLEQLNGFLDELEFLATTAGYVTVEKFYQKLRHPDTKNAWVKGKLEGSGNLLKPTELNW